MAFTAFVAACGDGKTEVTPTIPAAVATATAPTGTGFGPPPAASTAVLDLFPRHATAVTRADLLAANPLDKIGVCFAASFTGLPDEARSFTMRVDGKESTLDFAWTVPAGNNPRPPRACYEESDKLAPGRHTVAVAVRASSSQQQAPRETITWEFDLK